MSSGEVTHEIQPGETYQIDSSEYDSDEERDGLDEDEYDRLVDEGKHSSSNLHSQTMHGRARVAR
jgi:NAD-dependent histone deacetylase SIR2